MKRLVSALLVATLAVVMVMPVSAAVCGSSSVKTSAKAEEAVQSSSANNAGTQVSPSGEYICYESTGTPQGINNAYLANMASNTKIGGVAAAAMTAHESKAMYDFAKVALGKNCYMITAYKPVAAAAGLTRVENPSLKAGTNVTVFVTTAKGIVAVPAIVADGAITIAMPEGAISVAIFYNAVAPW